MEVSQNDVSGVPVYGLWNDEKYGFICLLCTARGMEIPLKEWKKSGKTWVFTGKDLTKVSVLC